MTKLYRITILPGKRNVRLVERLNEYAPTITGDLWECELTDEQVDEIRRLYARPGHEMVDIESIERGA